MNRVDFLLDADELAPVIKALQKALITHPNPEGKPHFDLQTALDSCDEYVEDELNCFNTWLDGLATHQRIGLRPTQGYGLGKFSFPKEKP